MANQIHQLHDDLGATRGARDSRSAKEACVHNALERSRWRGGRCACGAEHGGKGNKVAGHKKVPVTHVHQLMLDKLEGRGNCWQHTFNNLQTSIANRAHRLFNLLNLGGVQDRDAAVTPKVVAVEGQ